MRCICGCGAAAVCAIVFPSSAAIQGSASHPPQQPSPVFRSGVDLVTADVTVVDSAGHPVRDLQAADFDLKVDGAPRRIVSIQFVGERAGAAPPDLGPRNYSSNEHVEAGRLLLLVVDQGNIRAGQARLLARAADQLLSRLSPADRVGVVAIPVPGPRLDFTTDHALVREALGRIVGYGERTSFSFNIGLAEAIAIESRDPVTFNAVVTRECGPDGAGTGCDTMVETEAVAMATTSRHQARTSILALNALLGMLRHVEAPKTLVLVSEGLLLDQTMSELMELGATAAAARTSIYGLRLDSEIDLTGNRSALSQNADSRLQEQGFDLLVGFAKGAVFRAVTDFTYPLRRIADELSGQYLLSFEPGENDRNGKTHRVSVTARRKGLTVRSRREFRIDPVVAAASSGSDEELIGETLRAPFVSTALPIRLATYSLKESESGKMRVVISADLDRDRMEAAALPVGYAFVAGDGRLAASAHERAELRPVEPGKAGPLHYLRAVTLDPGEYILRLAAMASDGRRGSVERVVRARLGKVGDVQVSDLVVIRAQGASAEDFVPGVDLVVTDDRLVCFVEVYGARGGDLPQVTMAVSRDESSPPLLSGATQIASVPQERTLSARSVMSLALLPPGDYVVRAVVSVEGRETMTAPRPIRVVRSAPVSPTAVAGGKTLAAARVATHLRIAGFEGAVVPFDRAAILQPAVVTSFLDRMNEMGLSPASKAVQTAVEAARNGRFDATSFGGSLLESDRVAASFVRGLALLSRNQLESAASEFRATITAASDFFPAVFYLGAVYAAAGRDEDAVGAWQTSLISESETPLIYRMLADALLRRGDPEGALAVLREADEKWPSDPDIARRTGLAFAIVGDGVQALEHFDRYLASSPQDQAVLFAASRIIYEAHASGGVITTFEQDRHRLTKYAQSYAATRGPHQPLVAEWLKFVAPDSSR
ncbi:MAG: VWA domain-containing protein [Acidobacteria bacterium]|nr:VWA domain-containing protein [Acidobacteriota bacterium]